MASGHKTHISDLAPIFPVDQRQTLIGFDSLLRSATTEMSMYAQGKQKIRMNRVETQGVNVENPNVGKTMAAYRMLSTL